MAVWIGTGGTPISSKERSTLSGLERIHELGLNCMEVEFVRGVHMKPELAEQVGELAKKLKIRLSVHAPYYINLASTDKEKIEASKKRIIDSCERGHSMGAKIVVFHPAYYGKLSPEECYQRVKRECEEMVDKLNGKGINDILLGLETMGKISQFGTVDECVRIAKEIKGCGVCVDWAHIYARNQGKIDFGEVIDKVLTLKNKHIHSHFSGINYGPKGERNHLALDSNQPKYDELVKEINSRGLDITLISESPALEEDALKLKKAIEN
ncbi:MAG: TIM barrel protein [Candidatus Aenigmarchaeota archaeon]|nr:TIM barrel protein [Candidatus Aenigmarchaeota archaeon]